MTLLTLNMTWRMAVYWKNGAAPSVTPGMRVVMVMSDCDERVEIWIECKEFAHLEKQLEKSCNRWRPV